MDIFTNFIKDTPLPRRLKMVVYNVLPSSSSDTHHCITYYEELPPVPANSTFPEDPSIVFGDLTEDGLRRQFRRICHDNAEPIYPINRLRNSAIQNIDTTHFLVLDMDMWPVETAYRDMLGLPPFVLRNERLAVIIPAFSLKEEMVNECDSLQSCVEK